MKKLLLMAAMLLTGTSAFAQVPDASEWKKGDEITSKISWGNLSFQNDLQDDQMDYWQLTSSKGSFTKTGGLFEVYDGADVELYQYVELPAGMYRVQCQGYYRCGTSWDDDPNSFGNPEKWQDNALLTVQNGKYDVTSNEFAASRTFANPLMPRLFLNYPEQIYVGPKEGEDGYPGWDMSDGNYGDKGWGPCSVPGSQAWFDAGLYAPYENEDEEIQYNMVDFFVAEPGYVRIAVTKIDPRSADSFMVTNFQMFYEGEVDPETVELIALQSDIQSVYNKLNKMANDLGGGLLYTLVSDALMDFDGEYDIPSLDTKEKCEKALDVLNTLYADATAALASMTAIEDVMRVMDLLYNTTDYAGKADFGAAITAAKNCIDPNYEKTEADDFDTFTKAYNDLIEARITYLLTQEPDHGAYNFSAAISTPFFCDDEYTPRWNAEAGAYQFPTIEGVADELQPENTWATIQEQGYSEAKGAEGRENWVPICENVTVKEKFVENTWIMKSTTWHGGGPASVTMQHSYPAIGGWTAEPTGNPELLYQTITGLPNGFYSMSALMCNAGADVSALQFAYIEAGDMKETAPLTQKGNPWWGGSRDQWRQTVWEKLTTNMVYVSDGKVTIGTSSDAFYASTGFQLYYYGETPDFSGLLTPSIEAAKANIATLAWPGDIAAANAIMAQIPETINDQDQYQAALKVINDVNTYVTTANNVINNWKGLDNFAALGDQFEETSPEYAIVQTAWAQTLTLGDNDTDTYLDAIANDNDYAAYVRYFDYRASMGDLIKSDNVAPVIAEQNAYLTENYATAEKIDELIGALAGPYNAALLASLGIANASESNPVDITALIINPKFDEGSKGWQGTAITVTGPSIAEDLGAAEVWNCDFDVYQTIKTLPAGCYQIQCQTFYRDGGDAKTAYNNWEYDAGEDMEFWTPNVVLYANECDSLVNSIASEKFTTRSMTEFRDKMIDAEEGDAQGNIYQIPHWKVLDLEGEHKDEEGKFVNEYDREYEDGSQWYWDSVIEDIDDVFYYPASLTGATKVFEQNPDKYVHAVTVMVPEGGDLRFGLKNTAFISNHWCVFDNFKLFYLGKEPTSAISNVEGTVAARNEYYSISGARLSAPQRGINIVRKANGQTVKIFVK